MKTTIKKSLVIAFMLGTLIGYANVNSTTSIDAKKVKIEFRAVKKGENLTIKSKNGIEIYNKEIQVSGNYSKYYDLSALKNGMYITELNTATKIIIKPFIVENSLVTFLTDKEEIFYKPEIKAENNSIYISKKNSSKEPVSIVLYYKNELIYSNTFIDTERFNKVFRLLKTEKGKYTAIVFSKNKSFKKEIEF